MARKLAARLTVLQELFTFLGKRKLWWLIPLIAVLVVFGLLLILASISPALTPFVYTLF